MHSPSEPVTMSRNLIAAIGVGCLIAGYLVSTVSGFDPINPFVPRRPDRPVIRFLARLAKLGLWVTVFAEPAPRPVEEQYNAVRASHGAICHAEGW